MRYFYVICCVGHRAWGGLCLAGEARSASFNLAVSGAKRLGDKVPQKPAPGRRNLLRLIFHEVSFVYCHSVLFDEASIFVGETLSLVVFFLIAYVCNDCFFVVYAVAESAIVASPAFKERENFSVGF